MSKKPTGIVNPFQTPEKKKTPLTSPYDDPYGLESEEKFLRPAPVLDLDGDSYIIRFLDGTTDKEEVTTKLTKLLYNVNAKFGKHLKRHGVWVGMRKANHMVLKSSTGLISVFSEEKTEVDVFRRIGFTLWTLPDKQILKQHNVKILQRG